MDESMVSAGIDLYLSHTNETDTIPMADGTEIDITPMAQKPIVLEFVLFGFWHCDWGIKHKTPVSSGGSREGAGGSGPLPWAKIQLKTR